MRANGFDAAACSSVAVTAPALPQVDYKRASWDMPGGTWPHVLGCDVAGVVDAVGPGTEECAVGERVRVTAVLCVAVSAPHNQWRKSIVCHACANA